MIPILDIHPGYLGSRGLIEESGLLHRLLSDAPFTQIEKRNKQYLQSWGEHYWGAYRRYAWLTTEMKFRGIALKHPQFPVQQKIKNYSWPELIGSPAQQFSYRDKAEVDDTGARIPEPKNPQQLWAQHKYSILARDVNLYRELGPKVAAMKSDPDFSMLASLLTLALRTQPEAGGIRNALQHMWGYVSEDIEKNSGISEWSLQKLNREIQKEVVLHGEDYLLHSTALTDLQAWLPEDV